MTRDRHAVWRRCTLVGHEDWGRNFGNTLYLESSGG
jgi:hypothetical protein